MNASLTLRDGRQIESVMKAHSVEYVRPELTPEQGFAKSKWEARIRHGDEPIRTTDVSQETIASFKKAYEKYYERKKREHRNKIILYILLGIAGLALLTYLLLR